MISAAFLVTQLQQSLAQIAVIGDERTKTLKRLVALLISTCLGLMMVSCKRDPNVRKQNFYQNGVRYLENGQYNEASIEFHNAVQIDPQFADAHYQLAKASMGLNNWQVAAQELQKTVSLRPSDFQAQYDLGSLYLGTRNLTDAEQIAFLMLEKAPDNADSHALMANIDVAQNKMKDARKEFDKALALAPNRATLQFNVGVFEVRSGNSAEAEKRFKRAVELDPKLGAARVGLADLYFSEENFAAVEQTYREGIAANPGDVSLYNGLAAFYNSQNRRIDAEAFLSNSKASFNDNIAGQRLLGDFYVSVGDETKARAEFANLFREHPEDTNIKASYVEMLIRANQLGEASRIIEDSLKKNAKDSEAIILKAHLLNRMGKYPEALGILEPSYKDLTSYHAMHLQMGIALNGVGDLARAESEWREAVQLNPNLAEAYSYLAAIGQQRSDFDLLRNSSEKIIALRPNSAFGYIYHAGAEAGQGDYASAEADLKQALAVAPDSPDGYTKMGMLRGLQKKYMEAERLFEIALQKDPNATEALTGLVNTYATEGRPSAKSIARISVQISKAPQNSAYWALLGRTQTVSGDRNAAKISLEHSLSIDSNNSEALTLLAENETASGNLESAADCYQKLVQRNPRSATPLVMYAGFEQSRGNFEKAQLLYRKALDIQPDQPIAANNLAVLMMEHGGNIDVALSLAQTARRTMPNNASTADTLGWAYYMKGLYGSARDILESALRTDPDNVAIHYHLARTYEKISDPAKATRLYKRALQLAPNGPNATAIRQALSQRN